MNDLQTHLFKTYFPHVVTFALGVIVCLWFRGCGGGKVETVTIEKPVPKIEYVDRWKYDTTRFTTTKIIERVDTIHQTRVERSLDTLLLVDTVKIVETWLSEVAKYDTSIAFDGADIRLRWQNYQNFSEQLKVDYTPKKVPLNWALGVHGNVGMLSDFQTRYTPLFGLGLQVSVKKTYIAANYGFNGQHFVSVGVGYNFINR